MSDIFNFNVKIGGTEESVNKFLSYTYAFGNTPPENQWIDLSQIEDVSITQGANGMTYAEFCCLNSKGPWSEFIDASDGHGRISLYDITCRLNLVAEVYVFSDYGHDHIIIRNGQEELNDFATEWQCWIEPGEFETFEEWAAYWELPEGTTLWDILESENKEFGKALYIKEEDTWEKFNQEDAGCSDVFHYGGLENTDWTI